MFGGRSNGYSCAYGYTDMLNFGSVDSGRFIYPCNHFQPEVTDTQSAVAELFIQSHFCSVMCLLKSNILHHNYSANSFGLLCWKCRSKIFGLWM